MSGLSRIGLLKTQQSQDMQESFWLAISNLSPPFWIPRTDPVGHFHWPMTRQLITANRTSIIAFESTSTANSTTFTLLPSRCLSNTCDTGENMFVLVSRVLDVLCPRWRTQMIGVGSDGANPMIGHLQGVVTRIAKESANNKFYRVWCGLHQLDLVLKHAYTELWDNEVVDIMKKFIAHL